MITNQTEDKFNKLPFFIVEEIEYDEGPSERLKFFLSINRDVNGNWSCGYVNYGDEETDEMAIPELVTNSSKSLDEAATRMLAKWERFQKRRKTERI